VEVIEITAFRLAPGTGEESFLAADRRMQTEFVYLQPGLVRRTTARSDDGDWAVVVMWRSKSDADAAARAAEGDDASAAFAACVDATTVRIKRFETLD
jgi:hypothetical protein